MKEFEISMVRTAWMRRIGFPRAGVITPPYVVRMHVRDYVVRHRPVDLASPKHSAYTTMYQDSRRMSGSCAAQIRTCATAARLRWEPLSQSCKHLAKVLIDECRVQTFAQIKRATSTFMFVVFRVSDGRLG